MSRQRVHNLRSFGLLLTILFFAIQGFTQQLTWSNLPRISSKASYHKVLGENSDGIFVLSHRNERIKNNFNIEKYSHDVSFVQSLKVKIGKERLEKIFVHENGVIYITSFTKNDDNILYLKGYRQGPDLNSTPTSVLLAKIPNYDFYKGIISVEYNPGQQLFGVMAECIKNNMELLNFNVFDLQFTNVYTYNYNTIFEADDFRSGDLLLDTSGNFYMVALVSNSQKRRNDPSGNQVYTFASNPRVGKTVMELVNNETTFAFQPRIAFDKINNRIVYSGFYGFKNIEGANGVFGINFSIDSFKITGSYFTPFDRKFTALVIGASQEEKGNDINMLKMRKVVPRSDGGVVVLAERNYLSTQMETITINGIPQTSTRTINNYDEVIVASFDPLGTLDWRHVIHKKQNNMNEATYFSSVAVCSTDSSINIIYNDNTRKSGDVLQYSVNPSGWMDEKIMLKSDNSFTAIFPFEATQTGYNRIILPCQRNRQTVLLKVSY